MNAPQGDELERRLAELFQQRAATVKQAPRVDLGSDDSDRTAVAPKSARFGTLRENLGLLAAAVVVFVAIAGTVVGIQASHFGQGQDVSSTDVGRGSSAQGNRANPSCIVTAPGSWHQAIDAGAVAVDRTLNDVISANGSTGDYLVLQGNEPPSQTSALYSDIEVALFQGSRGVTIYTPEGSDIPHADPTGAISADWVTFAVARPQNLNYSYKVMLYDRGAGVTRTLVELAQPQGSQARSVLGAPVIAAGKVYWLSTAHNKPETTTTLESWDLARNSAAGSVPAAHAIRLVAYGNGVALLRTGESGPMLSNGAGAPLTKAQLDAAAGGTNFSFDGISKLSWLGSDTGSGVLFTTLGGGAEISREPLLAMLGLNGFSMENMATNPVIYPFLVVEVNESDGLLDLRTGRPVALPAGASLQAVVGDEVIFGTGVTKSGAAGLSRVALSALPPVGC